MKDHRKFHKLRSIVSKDQSPRADLKSSALKLVSAQGLHDYSGPFFDGFAAEEDCQGDEHIKIRQSSEAVAV